MRFAAFFRNLNLGRPGSPDRAQFIRSMEEAGARAVASVLSHGNAAFSAAGQAQAVDLMEAPALTCGRPAVGTALSTYAASPT